MSDIGSMAPDTNRIVIMGAGGRDFHNFNVAFRNDPETTVVAFTAAQIPGIADRTYPAALAGEKYPEGIPIVDEASLPDLIRQEQIERVVFAYSDLSHEEVMHKASLVLANGADFVMLGPDQTMIPSRKPLVAVCAVRTGSGKSQTSRFIGKMLTDAGLRVSLIRHPMPYGNLERMQIQRFETLEDIDESDPTIEEREEYEAPVREGLLMWAGVDYGDILRAAEAESDVIVWDGGNNDFPFYKPDWFITVLDPLRPGHELIYHPGEVNLRMADIVVINKVDTADPDDVIRTINNVRSVNPSATIVQTASPVTLEPGPDIAGKRVLVVEDGPTLTHGGMPFGAGTVAAREAGVAEIVDPRPYAVGSIVEVLDKYPALGPVLPAMGYGDQQLAELEETIRNVPCDVVLTGTPIDIGRIIDTGHPVRHATYKSVEVGEPKLSDLLAQVVEKIALSVELV
ncbi:MAG: cyclic 2,3-diphosphoglycerate synthase [Actinomycetota bacterium]|nr:cyclic 2,3-diphosphoglycerate synthase [Actinomycetota bacterium]